MDGAIAEALTDVKEGAVQSQTEDTGGEIKDQDRRGDFEKLIRGEYKAEFDDRVQRIIDKRFRETRSLKEQAAKVKPLIDHLREKYNENDAEKLLEKVAKDGAEAGGNDENERLLMENRQLLKEKRARDTVERWRREMRDIQDRNPAFDMKSEMKNPRFFSLLRSGVSVRDAYDVIHKDEMLKNAVKYAAEKTMERTLNDIRARGMRPEENGVGGKNAGLIAPTSVSSMTKKEREEIERRCARGEKVYFH
ncbi:MAG: hypothetical protein IJC48_08585 [Clostridia bacterium]|nr:hypothetical protein [Clostridia bacterium]